MDEIKNSYDGKFEGNILIVGRTRCGKTTFVQNLGKNNLFRDVKTVCWISKISLSQEREEKIKECFQDKEVNFHYRENVDDFNYLIEAFMQKKSEYVCNDVTNSCLDDKLPLAGL